MFAAAWKAARKISSRALDNDDEIARLPLGSLPKQFSFAQISDEINDSNDASNQEVAFERLLVLNSCLSQAERLQRHDGDGQIIQRISLWTARNMLPDGRMILNDELLEDSSQRQRAVHLARYKGALGLSCLKLLLQTSSQGLPQQPDPRIHISIIAFSSSRDAWTTPTAQDLAQSLLSSHSSQIQTKEFIIDHVVQSFIRPLFSKSKPEAITSTGRKAMPTSAPPRRHDIADLNRSSKPWKYESPYSVTVFSWAVKTASQEIITAHWNMFIPPLLTLLDTPTASIVVRGLETLSAFLPKFSSKLLQQTGLGEVFEDAIMPTLLYLPSITPKEESIQILPAAFEALFILVDIRYSMIAPSTSTALIVSKTSSTHPNTPNQKFAFLDRIMRKGILTAYLHASNYPEITSILLTSLSTLVSKMGINCVKHLKDILPVLTQALTDPFAGSRPEGLMEGIKCLRDVILNAWPRMGLEEGEHGMEVVRLLVVCWRIVIDAEDDISLKEKRNNERRRVLQEVKREIEVVGRLLVKAIEAADSGVDVKEELRPLLAVDASLGDIFGI